MFWYNFLGIRFSVSDICSDPLHFYPDIPSIDLLLPSIVLVVLCLVQTWFYNTKE